MLTTPETYLEKDVQFDAQLSAYGLLLVYATLGVSIPVYHKRFLRANRTNKNLARKRVPRSNYLEKDMQCDAQLSAVCCKLTAKLQFYWLTKVARKRVTLRGNVMPQLSAHFLIHNFRKRLWKLI